MDNELSNIMPTDSDELAAFEVLINHPQIENFMDSLERQPDGSFVMTITAGEQTYTFKDGGPGAIRRLAVEFICFNPAREKERRARERQAEAAKLAAEQAAHKKQQLLRNALLGSGGQSNGSF